MNMKAKICAVVWATWWALVGVTRMERCTTTKSMTGSSNVVIVEIPIAPRARDMRVIPIWVTE